MLKHVDCEFAGSTAAEAPLVVAYIVAFMFFAFAWTNFSAPAASIMELHSAATAKHAEKNYVLLP
jgi:hypothetical protein